VGSARVIMGAVGSARVTIELAGHTADKQTSIRSSMSSPKSSPTSEFSPPPSVPYPCGSDPEAPLVVLRFSLIVQHTRRERAGVHTATGEQFQKFARTERGVAGWIEVTLDGGLDKAHGGEICCQLSVVSCQWVVSGE
jgi:hypothetical protein